MTRLGDLCHLGDFLNALKIIYGKSSQKLSRFWLIFERVNTFKYVIFLAKLPCHIVNTYSEDLFGLFQNSSIYWLRILSVGDIENFHRREGVKLAEKRRGWRVRSLRSLLSLLSSVAKSMIALMYLRGGLLSKKQTLTIG